MTNSTPLIRFTDVTFDWKDPDQPGKTVFDAFSADIPQGFISLTGPNGTGKSTFMLLGGGRIFPSAGQVEILGNETHELSGVWADKTGKPGTGLTPEMEHKRNLICSFLYQNMEFESQEGDTSDVGTLLEYVYGNGGHEKKTEQFMMDVVNTFELERLKTRKLEALSKGEVQRVLLAFSAVYGSRVIMMDEPIFAMEQYQKERALEFFKDMQIRSGISVVVSLHELSLTRKFADTVLLFYPDKRIDMGTCEEVLTNQALEDAYGVPAGMLFDTENLTRNSMIEQYQMDKQL